MTGESSTVESSNETEGADADLDAPTDELMAAVRTIMEASQRGELTEAETDDRLREVVEQIVTGQVEAGRAIGEGMPEEESEDSRERRDEAEGGETKRPRENIGR